MHGIRDKSGLEIGAKDWVPDVAFWPRIPFPVPRSSVHAIMLMKKNRLAIWQDDAAKTYVIDIKRVIQLMGEELGKNAGGKNGGKSHYVVENKCRKNVRNRPRHYVYENKGT
jgi:hypothetical protein